MDCSGIGVQGQSGGGLGLGQVQLQKHRFLLVDPPSSDGGAMESCIKS